MIQSGFCFEHTKGQTAYLEGCHRDDNPYKTQTLQWMWWNQGWDLQYNRSTRVIKA